MVGQPSQVNARPPLPARPEPLRPWVHHVEDAQLSEMTTPQTVNLRTRTRTTSIPDDTGGGPATETVTSEARGRLRPPSLGRSDQAAAARSPGRRIRGSSGGAEPLGWIWIILPRTDPTEQQPGDSSWSESRQPPPSSVQSLCSSGGRPEPDLTQNMATAGNEEPARRYEFKVRSPNQDGPPDRS
jgi:hypothetical protein